MTPAERIELLEGLIQRRGVLVRQWQGLQARADKVEARIAQLDNAIIAADTPRDS